MVSGLIFKIKGTFSMRLLGGFYKSYPKLSLLMAIPLAPSLPAAVVTITWRVSGLKSETTPITLRAVMAGSDDGEGAGVVCALRTGALASNASVHSTRMLPKILMIYLLLDSQLISAQNQMGFGAQ